MTAAVLSIIGGIIALIVLVMQKWESKEQKEKRRNEEIQQGRKDIVDGNTDAVTARVDKLLLAIKGRDRNAGKPDSQIKGG